jgi:hypothetical protein
MILYLGLIDLKLIAPWKWIGERKPYHLTTKGIRLSYKVLLQGYLTVIRLAPLNLLSSFSKTSFGVWWNCSRWRKVGQFKKHPRKFKI